MTNEFLILLVPALAQTLVHFLWQGAAIGISAWLVLRVLRGARPQTRYAVACLALLACLWLPLQTLQRALQPTTASMLATEAATSHPTTSATTNVLAAFSEVFRTGTSPLDAATPWVVALWVIGVGTMLLRLLAGLVWLQRARRNARLQVPEAWQSRLRALCERMGLDDRVRMLISDDEDGPLSAGIFRPMVIVPAALLTRMPVEWLEALLAHELAHIRRHDYLVNLLQTLVESLLFYHPAVWWLSHRIRIERELIADDIAANALGEPRRLALALSALDRHAAAHRSHASHALAQAAQGGHLMTRIQQLLRPSRPGVGARVALPAVALIATGIACYAFAQADRPIPQASLHTPQHAPAQPVDADRGVVRIGQVASADDNRGHDSHALVKGGTEKFTFSGDLDDIEDIRAAQAALGGDFLWFRNDDGNAYVVRDPAVLARVERAWSATAATEAKMEAKSREMEAHSEKMEAMSQRMSALGEAQAPPKKMQESIAQLERMALEQGRLAQQQAEMAIGADEATQAAAEAEVERRMEALEADIERMSAQIEAESEGLAELAAPMEALAEEMEAAAKPMEALGAEMEKLGALMELEAAEVNREIRKEIERAVREGRAEPAPRRQ